MMRWPGFTRISITDSRWSKLVPMRQMWWSCQLVFLKDQFLAQELSFSTPMMCKKSLSVRHYCNIHSPTTCCSDGRGFGTTWSRDTDAIRASMVANCRENQVQTLPRGMTEHRHIWLNWSPPWPPLSQVVLLSVQQKGMIWSFCDQDWLRSSERFPLRHRDLGTVCPSKEVVRVLHFSDRTQWSNTRSKINNLALVQSTTVCRKGRYWDLRNLTPTPKIWHTSSTTTIIWIITCMRTRWSVTVT